MESLGHVIDLETIDGSQLATHLSKFYCEARPKPSKNTAPKDYHRNTMINIRGAINRYIQNIKRVPPIDICKDKEFKTANGVLDGLLKEQMKSGTAKPTQHKKIIERSDLDKISDYFKMCFTSPVVLRQCVWFQICIHFVSRGLELHHQLHLNSFDFSEDDSGEYATLSHETKTKTEQGGIQSMVAESKTTEKRMYATGTDLCPVKLLKHLINKSDPKSTHLFTQYLTEAVVNPDRNIWFSQKSLAKRTFSNFLGDICTAAGVSTHYTPHCLRATAIQHLNDQGFQSRHIMFMSSHKSEASLKSYSRQVSVQQKKVLSESLSSVLTGAAAQGQPPDDVTTLTDQHTTCSTDLVVSSQTLSVCDKSYNVDRTFNPGFLSGSTFNNCTFNFK